MTVLGERICEGRYYAYLTSRRKSFRLWRESIPPYTGDTNLFWQKLSKMCRNKNSIIFWLQARMKLPKKRRRVVAVEQPRRNVRRMGQGSIGGTTGHHGSSGNNGSGFHRRMNAIKGGHNTANHTPSGGSGPPGSGPGGGGGTATFNFNPTAQLAHSNKLGKMGPRAGRHVLLWHICNPVGAASPSSTATILETTGVERISAAQQQLLRHQHPQQNLPLLTLRETYPHVNKDNILGRYGKKKEGMRRCDDACVWEVYGTAAQISGRYCYASLNLLNYPSTPVAMTHEAENSHS